MGRSAGALSPREDGKGTEKEAGKNKTRQRNRQYDPGNAPGGCRRAARQAVAFQPVRGTISLDQTVCAMTFAKQQYAASASLDRCCLPGSKRPVTERLREEQELAADAPVPRRIGPQDNREIRPDRTYRGSGTEQGPYAVTGGKIAFAANNGRVNNDVVVTPSSYKRITDLLVTKPLMQTERHPLRYLRYPER